MSSLENEIAKTDESQKGVFQATEQYLEATVQSCAEQALHRLSMMDVGPEYETYAALELCVREVCETQYGVVYIPVAWTILQWIGRFDEDGVQACEEFEDMTAAQLMKNPGHGVYLYLTRRVFNRAFENLESKVEEKDD